MEQSNHKDSNLERINMQTVYQSILSIFNFDKGFLFTLKTLLIRPGQVIREFLFEDRTKLMKPMRFLILSVAFGTFISLKFFPEIANTEISIIEIFPPTLFTSDTATLLSKIMVESFTKYSNLFQLFKVPFIAIVSYLLFRKSKFNFAEHLVINAYLFSMLVIVSTLLVPMVNFLPAIFGTIIFLFTLGYMTFVFTTIFKEKLLRSFLKTVFAYTIANVLHILFMIIVIGVIYIFNLK